MEKDISANSTDSNQQDQSTISVKKVAPTDVTSSHIIKKQKFSASIIDEVVKLFSKYHELTVKEILVDGVETKTFEFNSVTLLTATTNGAIVEGKDVSNYTNISVELSRLYIDLNRVQTSFNQHIVSSDVNVKSYSSTFVTQTIPVLFSDAKIRPSKDLIVELIKYEIENVHNDAFILLTKFENKYKHNSADTSDTKDSDKPGNKIDAIEVLAKSAFCLVTIGSALYLGSTLFSA